MKELKAKVCLVALLLCSILLPAGCTDDKEEKIQGFTVCFTLPGTKLDKLSPFSIQIENESEDEVLQATDISFTFTGYDIYPGSGMFENLLRKYNDTKFQWFTPGFYLDSPIDCVLGEYLKDIEITCVEYFNATHPAGSEMGDITYFEWTSYYGYIQKGYDTSGLDGNGAYQPNGNNAPSNAIYHALTGDKSIYPIHMIANVSYLYDIRNHLYFGEKPDVPGIYTFNVKFMFETCTTEHQFKVKF